MILVANWPFYRYLFLPKSHSKEIEITYVKIKEPQIKQEPEAVTKVSRPLPEIPETPKMVSAQTPQVPLTKSETESQKKGVPAASESEKTKQGTQVEKKAIEQKTKLVIKEPIVEKIEVNSPAAQTDLALITPSYAQIVRSRIIKNLNAEKISSEGDVFVRFVITASGELKEISVIDERSSKNDALKVAASGAIKKASPFPRFPNGVLASEVTFTCQISFLRR